MDYKKRRTHIQNVFLMLPQALKLLRDVPKETGFLSYKDTVIREMKKQASCVCVCVSVCQCMCTYSLYYVHCFVTL